jgi:large subunit ribosomal protein L24e
MTKCVFCGNEAHDFMGVHLIKNDGTIDFYCSSKCRKNALKLERDRRNVKWTQVYKTNLGIANDKAVARALAAKAEVKVEAKSAVKSEKKVEKKSK